MEVESVTLREGRFHRYHSDENIAARQILRIKRKTTHVAGNVGEMGTMIEKARSEFI
jgi:hypothetical protein